MPLETFIREMTTDHMGHAAHQSVQGRESKNRELYSNSTTENLSSQKED